jgi:hypothetical protein
MSVSSDQWSNTESHNSVGAAEWRVRLARGALQRACDDAWSAIGEAGFSSKQVERATNLKDTLVRKLGSDGDKTGWRAPSLKTCQKIDEYCRQKLKKDFNLTTLKNNLARASKALKATEAAHRAHDRASDVAEARQELLLPQIREYLQVLRKVLITTQNWQPYARLDEAFEPRRVSVQDEPPTVKNEEDLYSVPHRLQRGTMSWGSAIRNVPVAVVLADAGYGKTWLLRRHGLDLLDKSLVALDDGVPVDRIELPLWMHASDLATCAGATLPEPQAFAEAALVALRRHGFCCSVEFEGFLRDRVVAGTGVDVLVDAYDEVLGDSARESLADALRWLGSRASSLGGPRLYLTSRQAGYDDPFQSARGNLAVARPRYLLVGVLDTRQVRRMWETWFSRLDAPLPGDRLEPVLTPESPLREFVRVPLIAAFCAWVAEQDVIERTRTGLYGQVVRRFVARSWKPGDSTSARQDGPRRAQIQSALGRLAWRMAAGPFWRDAITPEECDRTLAESALVPRPGSSHAWELIREIGILVQPSSSTHELHGDGPVTWVHRSVHEYLAAIEFVKQTDDVIATVLDTQCWLHTAWANVLDFALGLEAADDRSGGRATRAVRERAIDDHDALGWFATVFAAACGGLPDGAEQRDAVTEQVRRLHRAALLPTTHMAKVLALVPGVSQDEVTEALLSDLDSTDARQQVWEALSWCGDTGRRALEELVRTAPGANGAAAALLQVDPPRATAAMAYRVRMSMPVEVDDSPVLHELDDDSVALLAHRYLSTPDSVSAARSLAYTQHQVAHDTFEAPWLLDHDDPAIRVAAAAGLSRCHGNDISDSALDRLFHLAEHDPEPTVRDHIVTQLRVLALDVPWVEARYERFMTTSRPSPTEPESAPTEPPSGQVAAHKLVRGLLKGTTARTAEVDALIEQLLPRALQGAMGVEFIRDLALLIGEPFVQRARQALETSHDLNMIAAGRLAVGLSFALPEDPDMFALLVHCAGEHPGLLLEAAMRLHSIPVCDKVETLTDAMKSLHGPNPKAVRVWVATLRALLLDLPYAQRQSLRVSCGDATAHVLALHS